MATMKQAIKEAFEQSEGALSKEVIRQFVDERYPGIWQPSTLTAPPLRVRDQQPEVLHSPPTRRAVPLQKTPTGGSSCTTKGLMGRIFGRRTKQRTLRMPRQAVEASIGLERDIEDQLAHQLDLPLNRA